MNYRRSQSLWIGNSGPARAEARQSQVVEARCRLFLVDDDHFGAWPGDAQPFCHRPPAVVEKVDTADMQNGVKEPSPERSLLGVAQKKLDRPAFPGHTLLALP